jgi:hypothetical protein
LRDAALPLPPLQVQQDAVKTRTRLRDLRLTLDAMERELTHRPREANRLRRELRRLGQTDPLKPWIEEMPFPLGSIAWRYRSDAEPVDKVDHLLRLYESSAQFFATVLLSAFDNDAELRAAERRRWGDQTGHIPLEQASFGNWTKLGLAVAASTRRLLSSTADHGALRERMAAALGVRSPAFIRLTTGKPLWTLLDGLSGERNEEKHGGRKGQSERRQQLTLLEAALAEFRAVSQEAFEEVQLVRPGEGAFRSGVNEYRKALHLSGFATTFRKDLLESTVQLEADALYLVDVSDEPTRAGLKLAPLVRLGPDQESDEKACYFYNRLTATGAEYVSHASEQESRIPVEDEELSAFFDRLTLEG